MLSSPETGLPSSADPWPRWLPHLLLLLLLPLIFYSLFYQLGGNPIPMWDEGRLAVNAAEMDLNNNWIVTYFGGAPDMWNTKPPLMIWLEVLSLRLFGYTNTALRLPSAFAALATVIVLYVFARFYLRQMLGGVFAVIVLLTSDGYIDQHVTRTGDYDSLLTLMLTSAALFFFWYLESGRRVALVGFATAIVLAALTKGVAGLFWLPPLVFYTVWRRRLFWLLQRREVYVAMIAVIAVIASYYITREQYNPGYWRAVSDNELGGRLLGTLDNHSHPWYWFIQNLYDRRFAPWLLALPFGLFMLGIQPRDTRSHKLAWLVALLFVFHITIISTAKTKLVWYDAPVFPLASLVVGLGFGRAAEMLLRQQVTPWKRTSLVLLFIAALFFYPIQRIVDKLNYLYSLRFTDNNLQHGFQIKALREQVPQATEYTVFSDQNYEPTMTFYAIGARKDYGHDVTIKYRSEGYTLHVGELVLVCGESDRAFVQDRFETIPVLRENNCAALYLQAIKKPESEKSKKTGKGKVAKAEKPKK
ncbi:glycosyltransferase family 39 protein [Hymenobacter sp. BT188]|uniref:ArnT family glycosyltransferase n=1 Tax=Hymenobacter sp. BT188 TaxID=2763504 RepID=UPI0016512D0D|nr:glycosyltransferase family 39 protein [Hymenobacter sp. BT188]MBC6608385.1 glycosyltransferase family 39 protein [Hymenobacter sp. BT188]